MEARINLVKYQQIDLWSKKPFSNLMKHEPLLHKVTQRHQVKESVKLRCIQYSQNIFKHLRRRILSIVIPGKLNKVLKIVSLLSIVKIYASFLTTLWKDLYTILILCPLIEVTLGYVYSLKSFCHSQNKKNKNDKKRSSPKWNKPQENLSSLKVKVNVWWQRFGFQMCREWIKRDRTKFQM